MDGCFRFASRLTAAVLFTECWLDCIRLADLVAKSPDAMPQVDCSSLEPSPRVANATAHAALARSDIPDVCLFDWRSLRANYRP
mmetsp:Transcript_72859/g.213511  ORF Transcript_72859/g.213511 Transcript_72859/m.213511 type:complete len:84 (-) Transcript_72859:2-253(-)